MTVLGIIPARGGSKGFPGKNLAPLGGRPLICHTIEAALASGALARVLVSTDCPDIARTARDHGAETPFLRPAELAQDDTPAIDVIRHALSWLAGNEGWQASAAIYLQPTSPLRGASRIRQAVELLCGSEADAVVSVTQVPHRFHPWSVMERCGDGSLRPFTPAGADVLRRQDKPKLFARNGPALLAMTAKAAQSFDYPYAGKTLALEMDEAESVDIDGAEDLALAEWLLQRARPQA